MKNNRIAQFRGVYVTFWGLSVIFPPADITTAASSCCRRRRSLGPPACILRRHGVRVLTTMLEAEAEAAGEGAHRHWGHLSLLLTVRRSDALQCGSSTGDAICDRHFPRATTTHSSLRFRRLLVSFQAVSWVLLCMQLQFGLTFQS